VKLYIARHAETTWNLAGRYQGRRESALSARGIQQGFALADTFAALPEPVTRIVSSPMQRTRATAGFVGERLNVPVMTDDALIEIAHGTWEGRMREEIAANDPARYKTWREFPADVAFEGGESLPDVMARWQRFRATFAVTEPTLIVTHDAIVRIALLDIAQRPLTAFWETQVENAGYAAARRIRQRTPRRTTRVDRSASALAIRCRRRRCHGGYVRAGLRRSANRTFTNG
jgi:broad specificity phosphatase PhoE